MGTGKDVKTVKENLKKLNLTSTEGCDKTADKPSTPSKSSDIGKNGFFPPLKDAKKAAKKDDKKDAKKDDKKDDKKDAKKDEKKPEKKDEKKPAKKDDKKKPDTGKGDIFDYTAKAGEDWNGYVTIPQAATPAPHKMTNACMANAQFKAL